jgi:hypothetical protein
MKRILLSFSAIVVLANAVSAQGISEVVKDRGVMAPNQKLSIPVTPNGKVSNKKVRGYGNFGTIIGRTYYDLQSNASMSRRVVNHGGGKVSAVWTTSATSDPANGTFADRGTGYNYNNGSGWGPAIATRVESQRTGFCSLIPSGAGEQIFNHNATSRSVYQYKNTAIGSSAFTLGSTLQTPTLTDTVIWPKVATSGNNIYVIGSLSNDPSGTSTGLYFSKSSDGGLTWPINTVPMPGLTKSHLFNSSADAYNIDANGPNVSVVVGRIPDNMFCIRSTDFGVTWVLDTIIDNGHSWNINPLLASTEHDGDTIRAGSDGSAGIIITDDGTTHVLFNEQFWSLDSADAAANVANPANATYSYYILRSGRSLVHWTPGIAPNFAIAVDSAHDCDGDGAFTFGQNHFPNTANTTKNARYGAYGLTNQPQMAPMGNDTIFAVYSAVIDGDTTSPDFGQLSGQNFRDIMVKIMTINSNGNITWSQRVNISNSPQIEDHFPTVAKVVDDKLHIVWQSDNEPGCVLTNGDDQDAGNNIIYWAVPVSYLFTHAADGDAVCQNATLGPDGIFSVDKNGKALFTLSPNPANSTLFVNGNIFNNTIEVYNTTGQLLNVPVISKNNTTAVLDVMQLPAGVYIVKAGNGSQRFVKE